MHVEIRLCEVEQACAFDPQSFYRVKQLLSCMAGVGNGDDEPAKRGAVAGSLLRLRQTAPFTPELKLQVVMERLIEMESTCFPAKVDKRQHEARVKSNWNNSAVGTAYHSAVVGEVILAALPLAAADSVVKIRLLQLPPPLDYDSQQVVKRAMSGTKVNEHRHDTPLCIGVAKISLRELMSARRTVRIAMQAKRSVVSGVEAHNLDTLITNAMFGRGESSGSALLSVQVNGYTFGRVPRGIPERGKGGVAVARRTTAAGGSDTLSNAAPSVSSTMGGEADMDVDTEPLNSPAIRLVLIPYVALADAVLRVVDVASWRVRRKTGMALLTVVVALYADLFDVLFVLAAALASLCVVRSISLFYSVPFGDPAPSRSSTSPVVGGGVNNFQPFLYSRDNALLNSLLRARIFFSRGLMEDTYLELALVAHLARRHRRTLASFGVAVCCGFVLLSMGTVVILLTLGVFTVFPLFMNVPATRRRSRKRKGGLLAGFRTVVGAVHAPRRYQVIRVVHVSVVRARPAVLPSQNDSVTGSTPESVQQNFLNCIRQRTESVGLRSQSEQSETSLKTRENSSSPMHRRARTTDFDLLAATSVNFATTLDRFHVTHVMRYFVALCFSPSGAEQAAMASTNGGTRRPPSTALLQRRLCEQLRHARLVNHMVTSELQQSNNLPANACSVVFTQQASSMNIDAKTPAVSKEVQEAFQAHFQCTLTLLSYLRNQWTCHAYVTQSSTTKCAADSMRSVTVLAQPQSLVDAGEDDGVTKAVMARLQTLANPPMVGKFSNGSAVEVSGRVIALYATYLLQGARLSVYVSSSGCATVLPLLAPGNRIERFPQPNPCPVDLLNTLDSVWRGEASDASGAGKEVYFNADAVLQIITVYKDFWDGGGSAASAVRPAVRYDPTAAPETPFTSPPQRNPIRHVFASLSPMPRHQPQPRNTATHLTGSPRMSTTVAGGGFASGAGNAGATRGDPSPFRTAAAREANAGLAVPLDLPPAAAPEPPRAKPAFESSSSISVDPASFPSGALGEPPVLEATSNGDPRGLPLPRDDREESPDPKLSAARASAARGPATDKSVKAKR